MALGGLQHGLPITYMYDKHNGHLSSQLEYNTLCISNLSLAYICILSCYKLTINLLNFVGPESSLYYALK